MKRNCLLRILVLIFPLVFYAQSDFDCSTLNPVIENTEINICEPGGNVVLEAHMNKGNRIYWYDAADSDIPIETGSVFDLGYVSNDESYWVSEIYSAKHIVENQGRKNYSSKQSGSSRN